MTKEFRQPMATDSREKGKVTVVKRADLPAEIVQLDQRVKQGNVSPEEEQQLVTRAVVAYQRRVIRTQQNIIENQRGRIRDIIANPPIDRLVKVKRGAFIDRIRQAAVKIEHHVGSTSIYPSEGRARHLPQLDIDPNQLNRGFRFLEATAEFSRATKPEHNNWLSGLIRPLLRLRDSRSHLPDNPERNLTARANLYEQFTEEPKRTEQKPVAASGISRKRRRR